MDKIKFILVAVVAVVSAVNIFNAHNSESLSDVALANVEALASGAEYIEDGICYGTGPGFTNQYCPGGYKICCWAHMDVFGKN